MVMALASGALLAAGRRLRSPTPILMRRCSSEVPTPPPTPTVAQVVAKAFEEFASFLKAPKPDLVKASQFVEELSMMLKEEESEMKLTKAALARELSKVLDVSSLESRLSQAEHSLKSYRKVSFGVGTLFAAALMAIPATVYIAKLDSDNQISNLESRVNQISNLESRVAMLETAGDLLKTPATLNVDARVCHGFKVESEINSPKQ